MTNIADGYDYIEKISDKLNEVSGSDSLNIFNPEIVDETSNNIYNEEIMIETFEGEIAFQRKTKNDFNIVGIQAQIKNTNPWTYVPLQGNYTGNNIELTNVKYETAPSLNEYVVILKIGEWNYLLKTGEIVT